MRPFASLAALVALLAACLVTPWLPAADEPPPVGFVVALKGHKEAVYGVAFSRRIHLDEVMDELSVAPEHLNTVLYCAALGHATPLKHQRRLSPTLYDQLITLNE